MIRIFLQTFFIFTIMFSLLFSFISFISFWVYSMPQNKFYSAALERTKIALFQGLKMCIYCWFNTHEYLTTL